VVKRFAIAWGWLLVLGVALSASAQVKLGEDVEMTGNGVASVGYQGGYGSEVQTSHGLQFGFDGNFSGYYYNPNFLNFNASPYYNRSSANSSSESLTDASGVTAGANFFAGSHFPGSVSYNYNYNSEATVGLIGAPNFTTIGTGQGFGISWSVLFPGWPTLTASYTQGSGSGNVYGTSQETQSNNHDLNVTSSYLLDGWKLNASYYHLTQNWTIPVFLTGQEGMGESNSHSRGDDFGFAASHSLPWNGQFYSNFTRSSYNGDYQSGAASQNYSSSYTTDNEVAGFSLHPERKLVLFGSESYISNLSGYLTQGLANNGVLPPPVNLGSSSNSFTGGGGMSYTFTQYLTSTAQATYYHQHYLGETHDGLYATGTVNYNRRLLNTFTFSAGLVDSGTGTGVNNLGFLGTVNAFRPFRGWELSGSLSYTQNVQSALISYTTSSYAYNANLHRRFANRMQWTVAFNGSHSGFTNQPGTLNQTENFGTTLVYKWISGSAIYSQASGTSVYGYGGLVPLPPLPGEPTANLVFFSGTSYGGNLAVTPLPRLSISATFTRSFSDTLSIATASRNNTEQAYARLQYRLRRLELQAGYTRLTQSFSAVGTGPATLVTYYGGISRWFNFF
jgi:hypothetical protein